MRPRRRRRAGCVARAGSRHEVAPRRLWPLLLRPVAEGEHGAARVPRPGHRAKPRPDLDREDVPVCRVSGPTWGRPTSREHLDDVTAVHGGGAAQPLGRWLQSRTWPDSSTWMTPSATWSSTKDALARASRSRRGRSRPTRPRSSGRAPRPEGDLPRPAAPGRTWTTPRATSRGFRLGRRRDARSARLQGSRSVAGCPASTPRESRSGWYGRR